MARVEYQDTADGKFRVAAGSAKALHVKLIDATTGLPYNASGGSGGGAGDASAANQVTLNTEVGIVTEAAPASDTASSGLNGRLQRIAQRITSLIALLPGSLGQKAAAASLAVTLSSDDGLRAQLPTTLGQKTAANSLAVSIASDDGLRVQLPASLGIKTAAASLSVAPASDAVFSVTSLGVTPTDKSGSITTGGTAQTAIASNASRKGYWIQNISSGDLWINSLATAVADSPSMKIPPGALYETPLGGTPTGAISVIGVTTGQKFVGREW